ncbi:hypothetical protein B9Z55_025908 [Caenorhabditis nigoni]|uniref:Uncharacterized protein n=1 Tax=Caenorhabditis nigoni TaxID=1611254 RepID=A0A2G5T0Y9_9PELO|nr:hypothetical protein B9Z55_025908 [Caenorhabditis nigoni]
MASSTSNIFHNTEERARTAEEEEEKTAGDRRETATSADVLSNSSETTMIPVLMMRPLRKKKKGESTRGPQLRFETRHCSSDRQLEPSTLFYQHKRYSDEPLMKVNTKPTTSSTTPLTATSSGENFNNGNGVIISQDRIRVRYMSGATRPLKALPLPEGWTERRRLQKNYARYPRIELLFNIIIHILSVQYSKTSIVLNVTK